MFISNKTLEQRVKASMASFWRLSEPNIYSQTNVFNIVRIHNSIQSCAEWTEEHGTTSCLYNHDGEAETEKLFAYILRSTGADSIDSLTK